MLLLPPPHGQMGPPPRFLTPPKLLQMPVATPSSWKFRPGLLPLATQISPQCLGPPSPTRIKGLLVLSSATLCCCRPANLPPSIRSLNTREQPIKPPETPLSDSAFSNILTDLLLVGPPRRTRILGPFALLCFG